MDDHDGYLAAAEFYDLAAAPYWSSFESALEALLDRARPDAGPIVDLGAGTGWSTLAICRRHPGARMWAIEPSAAQRAVLHAKLVARQDIASGVTVVPDGFPHVRLPERMGGFVAMSMLGHLDPEERRQLWQALATGLAPGAPAIVQLQPPARPVAIESTQGPSSRLGEHEYQSWMRAVPSGPRQVRWTMTYRVTRGEDVVREVIAEHDWWTVSTADVAAELSDGPLRIEQEADHGLLLITSA